MKKLLCLLATAHFLTGCNTIPPPAISLVDIQFGEATTFETTAQFTIRLTNGTPDAILLTGSAYKIYLNGLYVGEGVSNEELSLPAWSPARRP